jgi:hypothetical protein
LWWLGRGVVLRRDTACAGGLLVLGWAASQLAPAATARRMVGGGGAAVLLVLLAGLCWCFKKTCAFLLETAEYENLRRGSAPALNGRFVSRLSRWIEQRPFTAILLFALVAGVGLSGDWVPLGTSVRLYVALDERQVTADVSPACTAKRRAKVRFSHCVLCRRGADRLTQERRKVLSLRRLCFLASRGARLPKSLVLPLHYRVSLFLRAAAGHPGEMLVVPALPSIPLGR